jgi:hypothetical protein
MYQGTMNKANQLLKRINGSGLPSTGLFACTNTNTNETQEARTKYILRASPPVALFFRNSDTF